ncbi:MAG: acyltransferase [Deltaproteobacteria bacterium]|nr:acyltransferase [Deltaproteobacteria bacterium]
MSLSDQKKKDAERMRLFLQSGEKGPLVLEKNRDYDVCCVVSASFWGRIKEFVVSSLAFIAYLIPFSDIKVFMYRLLGVRIGRNCTISPYVGIDPLYPGLVTIEDDCNLGVGCVIMTHELTAKNFRVGRVRIGRGSVIGTHAIVRSGVTIGEEVTVGFGSVVTKDVKDGDTVAGVPAVSLKKKSGEGHGLKF